MPPPNPVAARKPLEITTVQLVGPKAGEELRITLEEIFQDTSYDLGVDPGLVKDISADIASWMDTINAGALSMYEVDGKNYGVPFDLGLVGFWYNTKASGPPSVCA